MTPTPEREKALRRIEQTKTMDMVPASELRGWLARYVALATDLEAAERWAKAERAGRKIERTRADNAEEMLRRSEAQTTAAERKAKELGRLADDEGSRRMSAERERDDLLRQRVELQNSIGGYVVQVDKLCEQRAKAWRDLATAREALERALPAIEQGARALIELGWTFQDVTAALAVRDALRSLGDVD